MSEWYPISILGTPVIALYDSVTSVSCTSTLNKSDPMFNFYYFYLHQQWCLQILSRHWIDSKSCSAACHCCCHCNFASFLISCVGGREGITRDDRLVLNGTGAGRAQMYGALTYFLISTIRLRRDVSHAARRPAARASGASTSLTHLCSRLQVWCQSTGWMWGRVRSSAFTSSSRWRASSSPSPWSCQGGWEADRHVSDLSSHSLA